MNNSRLRGVTIVAALVASGLALQPAFATSHSATRHKRIVTLLKASGSFAHDYPRVTQHVWLTQKCAGTTVGSFEANNQSASIVPISKYAGNALFVKFVPDTSTPLPPHLDVIFFNSACDQLDVVVPGKDQTQFAAQVDKVSQAGTIPTGAKWVMFQGANGDNEYLTSPNGVSWTMTIKTRSTKDLKPTAKVIPPNGALG